MIAVFPVVDYRLYREEFNRANGAPGANWRAELSNPLSTIVSNALQAGAVAQNTGRQAACWWTYQGGAQGGVLGTDAVEISAQLKAPSTSQASDNWTTLFLAGADTFITGKFYCGLFSTGSGCKIILCNGTPNGPGNSASTGSNQTQLATTGTNCANNAIALFSRDVNGRMSLKVNGTEVTSATDNTGFSGVGNRRWGVCIEANRPIFQNQFSAPGIDWVQGRDLP